MKPSFELRNWKKSRYRKKGENKFIFDFLQYCKAEFELWKHQDPRMPSSVNEEHWEKIAALPSQNERIRYLWRLNRRTIKEAWKKTTDPEREKRKFENLKQKQKEIETAPHLVYGLSLYGAETNALFLRLNRQSCNRFYARRMAAALAANDSPRLVVDLEGFDSLKPSEQRATVFRLQVTFGVNQKHRHPFNIRFAGLPSDDWARIRAELAFQDFDTFPYFIDVDDLPAHKNESASGSDRLVYILPQAREILHEFDDEKIYVLNGLTDKSGDQMGKILSRTKRNNIAICRLPIDQYMKWQFGRKNLPLDRMIAILLDFRSTKDWEYSLFRNVNPKHYSDGPPIHRGLHREFERLNAFNVDDEDWQEFLKAATSCKKQ